MDDQRILPYLLPQVEESRQNTELVGRFPDADATQYGVPRCLYVFPFISFRFNPKQLTMLAVPVS